MTERTTLPAFLALLLLAAAPQVTHAQTTFELGPRAGYEVDEIESFLLGADVRVSTATLPFQVQGTFDYYFADDDTIFENNNVDATVFRFAGNALYEAGLGRNEVFTPYFGPGLSITRVSLDDAAGEDLDETDFGLNLVGGAEFELANFGFGAVRPFVQAEAVIVGGDTQPAQVTGGILFNIGGN